MATGVAWAIPLVSHASWFSDLYIDLSRFGTRVIVVEALAKNLDNVFEKKDLKIGDDPAHVIDYLEWKASKSSEPVLKLAKEIIKRESGFKWWKCNETTEHKCAAGQGLFQVIYSTEGTCEKNFKREMNMLNPFDNIDCGWWLLNEGKGISHWDDLSWKSGKVKKWGSGPYFLKDFGF